MTPACSFPVLRKIKNLISVFALCVKTMIKKESVYSTNLLCHRADSGVLREDGPYVPLIVRIRFRLPIMINLCSECEPRACVSITTHNTSK